MNDKGVQVSLGPQVAMGGSDDQMVALTLFNSDCLH